MLLCTLFSLLFVAVLLVCKECKNIDLCVQKYIFYVRNSCFKPFFVLLSVKEYDFYEKYETVNTYFKR